VVLVNVNPAYRSHELRYVLAKSRIRALFLREKDPRANYREILADSRNGDASPGTRGLAGRFLPGTR
jgi:fatty-acyl-CoA synthase